MNICINVLIEYDAPYENCLEFLETLRKTKGDFSLCIVNNSPRRLMKSGVLEHFKDSHIIWNNVDVGFVTGANQSMHYSSKFDYSFFVNSKYALVINENWMLKAVEDLGENFLGGSLHPAKITNSEKIQKIFYAMSPEGLGWLSKWLNRYMVLPYVNSNAFLIKNSGLGSIKLPNSKYCDSSSYGLALTLAFMKADMAPASLKSIYSSDSDAYRHDVFSVIKQGAGLLYPIVIDSVRERLKN